MHTLAAIAAVVVGLVFLLASITKLARPGEWRAQAADLGVPMAVATPVPFVEAAVGALLVVQFQRPVMAWCATVLLVVFTVLLVVRLRQGRRPPCACFGSFSAKPIGAANVARNLAFIALALVATIP